MSHLTLEDLARLVDDAPSVHEAAHLGTCEPCRLELEAMREDVQALSMLPDMAPTPDAWDALERRLTAEGLIRTRARSVAGPRLLQIAAALVLFVAGSLAGRMTAGTGEPLLAHGPAAEPAAQPPARPAQPEATEPAPAAVGASAPAYAAAEPAPSDAVEPGPAEPRRAAPRSNPNVTLASSGFALTGQARTMDEAISQLREAEELYLLALTRYAELATQADVGDPVARLAALQSIVMTTQAALNQAPTDPVINGYHLTALAQRDATYRQVAAATGDRWY